MGSGTAENVTRKAMGGVGPEPVFLFKAFTTCPNPFFFFQLSVYLLCSGQWTRKGLWIQ